jgi:hypothetical protein
MNLNRQQRRAAGAKGIVPPTNQPNAELALKLGSIVEQLQALHKQNVKITEFNRKLYGSLTKLKEALERKGVITHQDFEEVEILYVNMLPRRETKIKEINASDMTDDEKIKFCIDDFNSKVHGYDKYNVIPVRDLNIAPGLVVEYLSSKGYTGDNLKIMAVSMGVPEMMVSRKDEVRPT